MFKPVVRIAIAGLISLGLIAAVAPGVQARLAGILQKSALKNTVYVSVDNQALSTAGVYGLESYFPFDDSMTSPHDCGSDPTVDY